MSKLDVRKHPQYSAAAARMPFLTRRPLVGHRDLEELAPVVDALPELSFPINSAGELLDQIGDDTTLSVLDMRVDPVRMIKYMPAYYFPIASYENLVEKMAELMRRNRRHVDAPKYAEKMKQKFRRVQFPIDDVQQLERLLERTPEFNIGGKTMKTQRTLGALPKDFFPIRSQDEFEQKAIRFLRNMPLIERE